MSLFTLVLFVLGLVLLMIGAEFLVRGAAQLATALGIPPLIVGLTVVAYSTSAPEMAVSVSSALTGDGTLALGNVIGSNIFNILFILGLSALLIPLVVSQQLIRLDVPIMIAASLAMFAMALDGTLDRMDGILLLGGMVVYTFFLIRASRREKKAIEREYEEAYGEPAPAQATGRDYVFNAARIVAGVGMLILGARWLVESAETVARLFGVSELIIGLTVVAAGTSLPEVAASVVASLRGERDIAVGNAIGSNISNLMLVLGIAAVIAPTGIVVPSAALNFDLPVMTAVALACFPILVTGRLIARWEGALFLAYYFAYALYLILAASRHEVLPMFSNVMLFFFLPLTVLTLIGTTVRALLEDRRRAAPSTPNTLLTRDTVVEE